MDAIMGVEQEETGDFIVNEKDKVVSLTQDGVKKVEQFFKIDNLADPDNLELQHNINLALRAHSLMHRDKDYVVKDDEVLIVDEFTGRIMPGRRFSDGLHQAIEAKEHVKVKRESKTLATITFQNFFNKYEKKSGMTGTALTEEKEFRAIYGMDVVEILQAVKCYIIFRKYLFSRKPKLCQIIGIHRRHKRIDFFLCSSILCNVRLD